MSHAGIIVLFMLTRTLCVGQDVWITAAYERQLLFLPSLTHDHGASLGFRFPLPPGRSFVEIKAALSPPLSNDTSLPYQEMAPGIILALGYARTVGLSPKFALDLGIEAGYNRRTLDVIHILPARAAEQHAVVGGLLAALRLTSSATVQPTISLRPFLEYPFPIVPDIPATGNLWGVIVRFGLYVAIPSPT